MRHRLADASAANPDLPALKDVFAALTPHGRPSRSGFMAWR